MLRRVYRGFLYHPNALHVHPLVGMLALGLQFILLLGNNILILFLILLIVGLENLIYQNSRGSLSILGAIFPLLIFQILTGTIF